MIDCPLFHNKQEAICSKKENLVFAPGQEHDWKGSFSKGKPVNVILFQRTEWPLIWIWIYVHLSICIWALKAKLLLEVSK